MFFEQKEDLKRKNLLSTKKKLNAAIENFILGAPFKEVECGRRDLNPGYRLGRPKSYQARLQPQVRIRIMGKRFNSPHSGGLKRKD